MLSKRPCQNSKLDDATVDSGSHDTVALEASVAIALATLKKQSENCSIDQNLARLDLAVAKSDWVLSVARNLKPNWYAWFDRPWSCMRLAGIRRRLRLADAGVAYEFDDDDVASVLSHVEFGVVVDVARYRKLRIVGIEYGGSRLRRMLASPFVWWGVSANKSGCWVLKPFRALWTMGRPEAGALHYKRPTPFTLLMILIPAAIGSILSVIGFLAILDRTSGVQSASIAAIAGCVIWGGILLFISWWFGVYGPNCADELDRLFCALEKQDQGR